MAGVLRDGESFLENHEAAVGPEMRRKRGCGDFLKDAAKPGKFLFPAVWQIVFGLEIEGSGGGC